MIAIDSSESAEREQASGPVVDTIDATRQRTADTGLAGWIRSLRRGVNSVRNVGRETGGLLVDSTVGVAGDLYGVVKRAPQAFSEGSHGLDDTPSHLQN